MKTRLDGLDNDADGRGVTMNVYIGSPSGNPRYSFTVGGEGNTATKKASTAAA